MMSRFALAVVVLAASLAPAPAAEPKLTAEDQKYLDKLIADFLFDPTGAERVVGEFHSPRFNTARTREGWLVRGKNGKGHRVYFTDGDSEPAPDDLAGIDFARACKERFSSAKPKNETREQASERHQRSLGVNDEPDLALAAWLHKLGHNELAAKALASAREDALRHTRFWKVPGPRELLCQKLARTLYREFRLAYTNRQDETALAFGTKLFKLYGEVLRPGSDGEFWQAESMLADLHRREKAGTFPEAKRFDQDELPDEGPERVAALIAALEDITDSQFQNRRVHVDAIRDDWRVHELIALGEPAIPALLDAFERDNRRTRSVTHPSVREPLKYVIERILQVRVADDLSDREYLCYPNGKCAGVRETVAEFRAYWDRFGKFPFEERMMKVLTDPRMRGRMTGEAAFHLASLNQDSNRCWLTQLFGNQVIAKFSNPTVAEAILAAQERHAKTIANGTERPLMGWREIRRSDHLEALVWLGDKRIVPTLAKHAGAETNLPQRLRLANTAFQFGERGPLESVARELETGTLKVRPFGELGRTRTGEDIGDLATVICELSAYNTAATNRALCALANPNHPLHRATVALLVYHAGGRGDEERLFGHPYWIAVVRHALDDTTPTGREYRFEGESVAFSDPQSDGNERLPNELAKLELRRANATERVCDRLAAKLSTSLIGAPAFHVLRTDTEAQLVALAEFVGRYDGRFRSLNHTEARGFGYAHFYRGCFFIPDVKPLNRAATFADVASGDAMFQLNSTGKRICVSLPAWATLEDGSRGLAVQAEIGPNGAIVYGVIFKRGMRAVPSTEIETLELFESMERIHGGIY